MANPFRAKRLKFQILLEELLESRNVYFQPPSNIHMKYPCIVYELNRIQNQHADNTAYLKGLGFSVMLITRNPEDEMILKLDSLPYAYFDTHFESDNLHHYQYTIYIE